MNFDQDFLPLIRSADDVAEIDIEFCRFLASIEPAIAPSVLMAALLTSQAYRSGDVCISLKEIAGQRVFGRLELPAWQKWENELAQSKIVGSPGTFHPLILEENRLYLHKLWHYEQNLATHLVKRASQPAHAVNMEVLKDGLDRFFRASSEAIDWQKVATVAALCNHLTIISGGPGTGKTTTILMILALLIEQSIEKESLPSIVLAAPTGKAAARMENSIQTGIANAAINSRVAEHIPGDVITLHQLLGARRHTATFKFNEDNPLPYDVVIIDEASMVDQAMMSKLMDALLSKSRLVLLGDKDQLASVEAGSVLGDICDNATNAVTLNFAAKLKSLGIDMPTPQQQTHQTPLQDNIMLLQKNYRFATDSGIAALTKAVNQGDTNTVWAILQDDNYPDVRWKSIHQPEAYIKDIADHMVPLFQEIRRAKSISKKLTLGNKFRILAAHRNGPWGINFINNRVEKMLQRQGHINSYNRWYEAKPIIINRNDYATGLSNGQLGICAHDDKGDLKVYFIIKQQVVGFWPSRLSNYSAAYALTVHKSQGSEFDAVTLILPNQITRVLSRELLYTAVSRARKSVIIMGNETILNYVTRKRVKRKSGLKSKIGD